MYAIGNQVWRVSVGFIAFWTVDESTKPPAVNDSWLLMGLNYRLYFPSESLWLVSIWDSTCTGSMSGCKGFKGTCKGSLGP